MAVIHMAKNIKYAKDKWTANVEGKGEYWQERVNEAIKNDEFCKGIAEFLGVRSCSPVIAERWAKGVKGKASAYNEGVRGKGDKWARKYASKMAGVSPREED